MTTTENANLAPENAPQAPDSVDPATAPAPEPQAVETATSDTAPREDAETFPREYVEKLRKEAAEARQKAKRADDYARALFAARVAATGRLADPSDLPFDPELVDDLDALTSAIDELLQAHPHYASRTPQGDIGQGAGTASHDEVDLAALLRRGA